MKDEVLAYIEGHSQEALELLMEIARIPAPSNHEEKRAEFCKGWLEQQGAKGVYVDEALNVVYPVGVTDDKPLVVFMAHLDVVLPDTEELPLRVENGCIYAPGVGDDTANLAALLMAAKYIAKNQLISPEYGILLVCNSGEEGLGNLKGSRKICETYGKNMTAFYTFDGTCSHMVAKAVGSRRYQVEVKTEGGHSYGDFGNRNAIAMLASMIHEIYKIQVPLRGKTTYNVGMISGGTSVNTIAQQAQMLFEYRSDDLEDLQEMEETFRAIVMKYEERGINLEVRLLGERPCGLAKTRQPIGH
ncbi:MAG: M20/M25/M40 family metallo-hydrolase [Lachnospiraceae bacterium]